MPDCSQTLAEASRATEHQRKGTGGAEEGSTKLCLAWVRGHCSQSVHGDHKVFFADASGSNGTNGAVVEQEPLGEPGWARERFSKLLKTWRRRNEGKEETVIKGRSQRGRSQRDFCRSWCL